MNTDNNNNTNSDSTNTSHNNSGPGRPRYVNHYPTGSFTLRDLAICNGVDPITGKGELVGLLTVANHLRDAVANGSVVVIGKAAAKAGKPPTLYMLKSVRDNLGDNPLPSYAPQRNTNPTVVAAKKRVDQRDQDRKQAAAQKIADRAIAVAAKAAAKVATLTQSLKLAHKAAKLADATAAKAKAAAKAKPSKIARKRQPDTAKQTPPPAPVTAPVTEQPAPAVFTSENGQDVSVNVAPLVSDNGTTAYEQLKTALGLSTIPAETVMA